MHDFKDQQNAENEFLKNNLEQYVNANTRKSLTLSKRYVRDLLNEEIQIVQKNDAEATTSEIIENSRIRIVHKRSETSQQINGSKNLTRSRLKIKQFQAEKMLKDRFSDYKNKINRKIGEIELICDKKFGGIDAITKEMSKNALTRQQLIKYYAKMLPKNVNLPKIPVKDMHTDKNNKKELQFPKIRSQSQKNIHRDVNKNLSPVNKQPSKLNKWYIDPAKRFLSDKQKTKYDWKTQDGVKNVIRTQILSVPGRQIKQLVSQIKNKFNRAPLFCKYAKFS